jgi:hypothetical protein
MAKWPKQNASSMNAFFGKVGSNQVSLVMPYPMRLSWDLKTPIHKFSINKKCHDSAKRVFTKVLEIYGLEEIKRLRLDRFGGCLNVRKMRGGSTWSVHAWGAAIDIDPDRNQLKWGKDQAAMAKPEYKAWWDAWEEEGWVSLGRSRNFDWMHVQAANL